MLRLPKRCVAKTNKNGIPVSAINCFLPTEVPNVRLTYFMNFVFSVFWLELTGVKRNFGT